MDNLITCWDDSLAWAGSKSFRLQDKVENRKAGQLSQRPKQKARENKRRQIAVKDIPLEISQEVLKFTIWRVYLVDTQLTTITDIVVAQQGV